MFFIINTWLKFVKAFTYFSHIFFVIMYKFIDLFTFFVQIVNFLILMFILNKFLYKPILSTLEKRREDIKNKIEEAEQKLKDSDKLKNEYLEKLTNLENENQALKEKALQEAKKIKELEIQKAKDDVEKQRNKFNEYLDLEQKQILENFNQNFKEIFINYSNKILSSVSNKNLNEEFFNKIVENINNLTSEKIEEINKFNTEKIIINSTFELNNSQKETIEKVLKNKNVNFSEIEYNIKEDLILGIEIKIDGYILTLNLRDLTEEFLVNINK